MATINFVNNTLIAGTTANPGLEDVLSATGAITANTANLFEITNNSGGQFNGFRFQLTSSASDFTYSGTTPTGGTIDGITVLAPDGVTHIIEVTAIGGPDADQDLADFFANLIDPGLFDPDLGPLHALDSLLDSENTVNGSAVADHATSFGSEDNTVLGNGGDDVVWGRPFFFETPAVLVGGAGNDTIRVEDARYTLIAGANQDGSGGAGETNTLEVIGSFFGAETITNINRLHIIDPDPPVPPDIQGSFISVDLLPSQIGNGLVSLTLAVDGSSTASPHTTNAIFIVSQDGPTDTTPVNLNLSGWTFTNWNQDINFVDVTTNRAVALNDNIVGTVVRDRIFTLAGDDTLQGGGGADDLFGGDGNDTFIFAANEAAEDENVDGEDEEGSDGSAGGTADTVLVKGTNDFTGVFFTSIERLVFGAAASATFDQSFIENPTAKVVGNADGNALIFQMTRTGGQPAIDLSRVTFQAWSNLIDKIAILGTKVADSITGSSRSDLIEGGGGSDLLQGGRGNDVFIFDTPFRRGVDHIVDFSPEDDLSLARKIFAALPRGELAEFAFAYGDKATDPLVRILYDLDTGTIRYDDDGSGGHRARIVAVIDNTAVLHADDFFVV